MKQIEIMKLTPHLDEFFVVKKAIGSSPLFYIPLHRKCLGVDAKNTISDML